MVFTNSNGSTSDSHKVAALQWPFLATGAAATLLIWRQSHWELLAIQSALSALAIALLWNSSWRPGTGPARAGLLAGASLTAIPVWGCLQLAASRSVVPAETWQSALYWLAGATVFWCAFFFCHQRHSNGRLLTATAAFAAVICLLATLQFFTSSGRIFWIWPAAEPQVFGPFQSRNNYATFALLTIPLVVWKGLGERTNWPYLAAAAWMAASVVASGSRAGAGLLLLEFVLLAFAFRRMIPDWRIRLGIAALVLVAVGAAGWTHLEYKLHDSDPLRYRREMAASALEMAAARPWTGFGLGAFPQVYPAYARFDTGYFVNHAHNDWAELAADGGLPAVTCLAVFALCTLPASLRNPWSIGIPLVFLHAIVDYPLQRLGVTFWVFLLCAASLASPASLHFTAGSGARKP